MNDADTKPDATPEQSAPADDPNDETRDGQLLTLSDEARERLLSITVGYDDVCRAWRREETVRLRALTGLLETVCHLTKAVEAEAFARIEMTDGAAEACLGILQLVHKDAEQILGRRWPDRPAGADEDFYTEGGPEQ